MKRNFAFVVFFLLILSCVFSVPLENLVSAALETQLRSDNGLVSEIQTKNPSPKLLPQNNELRQYVNRTLNSLNPGIMVEALHLYDKPALFHSSVDEWDEKQKTALFNQLLALSSLAGIQYFSASRNAMRTFYESSGVIDGPTSKNLRPDPVFPVLPAALTLYARQKDLTFGENVYRYDYVITRDAVFFTQENVTALSYGIIPAIGRGNLRSIVAIFDCGDSILVYIVSMARASSVPGMGERIGNSFNSRAEAVLKWFTSRANSAFS